MRFSKEGRYHHCILVLQLPCSARADDIGNYLEKKLDRANKLEGMSGDLLADVERVSLENISDMGVGEFLSFPLYQLCILTKDYV